MTTVMHVDSGNFHSYCADHKLSASVALHYRVQELFQYAALN